MPGPRAPIGTLGQHATSGVGLRRAGGSGLFAPATKSKKGLVNGRASDSDSDSDSNSDSDSDSSGGGDVKPDVRATSTATKSSSSRSKASSAALESSTSVNKKGGSQTLNMASRTKEAKQKSRRTESDSDSDSESEDSSSSDSQDSPKNAKQDSKPHRIQKGAKVQMKVESDTDSSSGSESESETGSEDESESDSESDSDGEKARKAKAIAKSNANTKQAPDASTESGTSTEDSSSSSEDSSSESEAEKKPVKQAKAKTAPQSPKPAKAAPKISNGGQTSKALTKTNEGFKSQEFVDASDDASDDNVNESMAVEKRKSSAAIHKTPEIIAQHFHLRKAEDNMDASMVAKVFRDAKAQGKQIWFFTTPVSVPIEVIQEQSLPLDKMRDGKTIFSHNGAEYSGDLQEAMDHTIKVFIPGEAGQKYESLQRPIDRVLHIKRVTHFNMEGESALLAAAPKLPRPQPEGLKVRYRPIGISDGADGKTGTGASSPESDNDVEMTQAPPAGISSETPEKKTKKRKHDVVDKGTPGLEDSTSASATKTKKARVGQSKAAAASQGSTPAKTIKQTPVVPPTVPSVNGNSASARKAVIAKEKNVETPSKSSQSKTITGPKSDSKKVTPVHPPSVPGMKSA
ncbi:DNA-directed RNA polymerase I subunit RPA34.5-domain-containing protein [Lasiosphaeria ovina]|uniref:DNA-directed RNA polymerase I subunit RPA34.5-domain-containing protein n=1 Tax=Lasiosphaeria ovina TaxID=92902 RepID=A0AAE0NB23_9PEZI|nr:DNA-directed RNA polymerase I subunit RPA34.5-domain-containing protein [Lasiosphaeria ovina]